MDTKGSTQPIKNQTQNRLPRLLAKNPEIKGGVSTMVEISKSIISGMVEINLLEESAKIGIWREMHGNIISMANMLTLVNNYKSVTFHMFSMPCLRQQKHKNMIRPIAS